MKFIFVLILSLSVVSCGSSSSTGSSVATLSDGSTSTSTNITNILFTQQSANCADYVASYLSNVIDAQSLTSFAGSLVISVSGSECNFVSNAIPNHDFNVNGSFATVVSAQNNTYTITTSPLVAASITELALQESAIFLNGVKLDLFAAACYGVGSEPLGNEKIGCGPSEIANPWRYDPMSPLNSFGTDDNNAHTQPDGTYHYHGNPLAMFDLQCESNMSESPVIGFAADGFPIYGPCFNDNGTVRKALSSYVIKAGARQTVAHYTTPVAGQGSVVSGNYDGQFRGDWEYSNGTGDLDECNGMTLNGQYAYYITETFPWVMNCYKGTRYSSFN